MATAIWDKNLAPYGSFETHLPYMEKPELDLTTDAPDHAKYVFSNGSVLDLTGQDLKFDADGNPTKGEFDSATFFGENGETLITLTDFSLPAKQLWSDTFTNGWTWASDLVSNGFLGDVLKGNDVVTGSSANDALTGYTGNDTIDGSGGDDQIYAWYGNDKLHGGAGNDFLDAGEDKDKAFGDSGNDDIHGHGSNDLLNGGVGNDSLYGGSGNDKIIGGAGDDLIFGEEGTHDLGGKDVMIGGKGADTFVFASATDSPSMKDRDLINDFSHKQHDHISLADAYDGELVFMTNGHFKSHHIGSVYAEIIPKHHDTLVFVDLDGDSKADMVLESVHAVKFKAVDFDL
jgi:Ca2+-binding RTX toxin-like protein